MNLDTAKILAGGSAKLSVGTGTSTMVMAYFQANAAGIGALCTLVTLVFYILFQWLAHKKSVQADKNKEKIDSTDDKLEAHIKETRDGIESILEKLNKDY